MVDLLRRVVTIVEAETGLVAYDPLADRAFLAGGADEAAAALRRGPALFTAASRWRSRQAGPATPPTRSTRRWFGR